MVAVRLAHEMGAPSLEMAPCALRSVRCPSKSTVRGIVRLAVNEKGRWGEEAELGLSLLLCDALIFFEEKDTRAQSMCNSHAPLSLFSLQVHSTWRQPLDGGRAEGRILLKFRTATSPPSPRQATVQ